MLRRAAMLRAGVVMSSLALSACGWNGPAEGVPRDTVSLAEAPPPVRGGTIAVSDDGTQLLVVDRDRAEVHAISLTGHEVTSDRVYPFDHDARPERAVLAGDARVAILSDSRLVRLDDDGRATTIGRTCASPTGLTWDSVRREAWVTCASGELVGMALDGTTRRAVLEPDLGDVLVHGDELWIAQVRRAAVLKVGADDLALRSTFELPDSVRTVESDTSSTTTTTVTRTDQAQAALRLIDGARGPLVLHALMRVGADVQSTRITTSAGWGGRTNTNSSSSTVTGPCGASALAVALSPADAAGPRSVLASMPYASDVAFSASRQELAIVTPSALVPSVTGPNVVVAAPGVECPPIQARPVDGQPTAVAYLPDGALIVQSREPGAIFIDGAPHTLSAESVRDTGHDLFHTAASASGTPCIACHIDGSTDGHVWDLGNGPRCTTTLRGGLTRTAPFHWDGRFADLEALFQSHFPGPAHTTVRRDQIAAFAHWVDALPADPHPPTTPSLADEGRALFGSLGCASCHGADGASPVPQSMDFPDGTWQVPSLVDVGERAPLGHDGCAADLDALLQGACDFPGHVVSDAHRRAALEAFLGDVRP